MCQPWKVKAEVQVSEVRCGLRKGKFKGKKPAAPAGTRRKVTMVATRELNILVSPHCPAAEGRRKDWFKLS